MPNDEPNPDRVHDVRIAVHRIEISYKTILALALTVITPRQERRRYLQYFATSGTSVS